MGAGLLHVGAAVVKTPFLRQLREWHPASSGHNIAGHNRVGHDDGLDAVAGCILAEPVRLPRVDMPLLRADWRRNGGAFRAENRFNP